MYEQALVNEYEDTGRDFPTGSSLAAEVAVERNPIVVIPGDGVGPEVVDACIRVLDAACGALDFTYVEGGDAAMVNGAANGIADRALDAIDRSGVVLKGPLKGPVQGARYRGDETLSRGFALHSAVYFAKEYPGIGWPHSSLGTDLAVVSDIGIMDEDDAPSIGVEAQEAALNDTAKLAFELADSPCWKQIHCVMDEDNVSGLMDGYHRPIAALRSAFPDVKLRAASTSGFFEKLVSQPHRYDVLLTRAAFAGALKAVTARLVGGTSMMAVMRIGPETAVFEPAHGPLERLAGRDVVSPMAMLLAGVAMLRHLNHASEAARVEEALWRVFRKGRTLPFDMARSGGGVGCRAFSEAVIEEMDAFVEIGRDSQSGHGRRLSIVAA